uniref:Putative polysaccharide-binding protein n=1 Tax=Saccharophagus degradans (strain 2-40 / ATCC 43961 / DSM 17024) TaxID=203122 RepID=UPI0031384A3E
HMAQDMRSEKRGLAYGYHSENDLKAMQGKVKWWYNWDTQADANVKENYASYGYDFVPMAWDENFNEEALRSFLDNHPDVKYLLGWNEPNFMEQANLTPAEAAAHWPVLEAIAQDYNLKLVAPAVNYSPGNVDIPGTDDDYDPWLYLDAFFEACEGCQVDYIAVHCYMKYESAFSWYVGEFERYNKPIWVTEWAGWDDGGPANMGEQMNFLSDTVRWMESNDNIYRYSWFLGRSSEGYDQFPYLDVLLADGELTPLGSVYTSIPSNDFRYKIPARIEAEGAHSLTGFKHLATTDTTGLAKLIAASNEVAEYKLNVEEGGDYTLALRLASSANSDIAIRVDGLLVYTFEDINTGGVEAWMTFSSTPISLTAGDHILRVESKSSRFGFNWLELTN